MNALSELDTSRLRGDRFAALGEVEGLTQAQLGDALGVSQGFISRVMNLERPVPAELALKASEVFSLPLSFFTAEPIASTEAVPTFRRSSQATAAQEKKVVRLFREASRMWWQVSDRSGYHEVDLPDRAAGGNDPETVASLVREHDGLSGTDPVRNVTRLMERRGVGVIHHLDPSAPATRDAGRHHDGVSAPCGACRRPLVALVGPMPGGVARLTLAHELGHLIFDQDLRARISSTRSPEEQRAFAFAGALLLPRQVVETRVSESTKLTDFLPIKAEYGITVGAAIMRAKNLGVISPARARTLQIQLSSMGWRREEPVAVAAEEETLLWQASSRVWPKSTVANIVSDLGLRAEWVRSWLSPKDVDPSGSPSVVDLDSWRRSSRRRG